LSEAQSPQIRGPKPWLVLSALVVGLLLGMMSSGLTGPLRSGVASTASIVGGLWLKALTMTVVPLIIGLLVTGIAESAQAAKGGRIAGRAVLWIVVLSTASAIIGMALMLLLLRLVPLSGASIAALRDAMTAAQPVHVQAAGGSVDAFFRGLVPENIVSAAANTDILPRRAASNCSGAHERCSPGASHPVPGRRRRGIDLASEHPRALLRFL
jgi:Na+/H+-dicarboxylate symporter